MTAAVPAPRTAVPAPDNPTGPAHDWVGAATIELDDVRARQADFRRSLRTKVKERIDVLEVYCRSCRRPLDEVGDQPCSAKINNEHLIGGTPGVRAKRKVAPPPPPGAAVVTGPRIQRRGLGAVLSGEA